MSRRELAEQNFLKGYNCAQSLALAFADLFPMQPSETARLASTFGGGMGRLREVCGAVSGMLMVAGCLYGYDTPESGPVKDALYEKVQELGRSFELAHKSIVCRDLLGLKVQHDTPASAQRTANFYAERPCLKLIGDAAEQLEKFIKEHPTGK